MSKRKPHPKQEKGSQQLHHERLAVERAAAGKRARLAFSKAMAAAHELNEVLDGQNHDSGLADHLPALDAHINAVYQDVLLMERDARAEARGKA
jgi:hypothetical protein